MYRNVEQAIAWLKRVFEFIEHYRYGDPSGPASGAQMFVGGAYNNAELLKTQTIAPARARRESRASGQNRQHLMQR
jgi:hypothetical protein